ncbi:MAG: hypothetical protein E6R04_08315 [Spirochaetes bacterium]|nr:MAG: hypothetical protein E6R04_08315 [Spirochaetota bacterium]
MSTTYGGNATFTEDSVKDFPIGRWTADEGNLRKTGYRMEVDFGLRHHTGREWTAVEHEPITDWWEFSASGGVWRNGSENTFGQNLYHLRDLDPDRLAPGWTKADVRSLRTIWERWHLNGMKAACSHMTGDVLVYEPDGYGGQRISCSGTVCPETGYTYGKAWLVEPLPDEVVTEVRRLLALARGGA